LEVLLGNCDIVLTGEGQFDEQAAFGKGPAALGSLAKSHLVPVVALCGKLGPDWSRAFQDSNLAGVFSMVHRKQSKRLGHEITTLKEITGATYQLLKFLKDV